MSNNFLHFCVADIQKIHIGFPVQSSTIKHWNIYNLFGRAVVMQRAGTTQLEANQWVLYKFCQHFCLLSLLTKNHCLTI